MEYPFITAEYLSEKFNAGQTQKQIASEIGCSPSLISLKSIKFGIKFKNTIPTKIEFGSIFGEWTVMERVANNHHKVYYHCRCKCGQEKTFKVLNLSTTKQKVVFVVRSLKVQKTANGPDMVKLTVD